MSQTHDTNGSDAEARAATEARAAAELAELAAVDQALRELPPLEPPPTLVQRTLARVRQDGERRKRSRIMAWGMLATAAVMLVVGLVALRPDRGATGGEAATGLALGEQEQERTKGERGPRPAHDRPAEPRQETTTKVAGTTVELPASEITAGPRGRTQPPDLEHNAPTPSAATPETTTFRPPADQGLLGGSVPEAPPVALGDGELHTGTEEHAATDHFWRDGQLGNTRDSDLRQRVDKLDTAREVGANEAAEAGEGRFADRLGALDGRDESIVKTSGDLDGDATGKLDEKSKGKPRDGWVYDLPAAGDEAVNGLEDLTRTGNGDGFDAGDQAGANAGVKSGDLEGGRTTRGIIAVDGYAATDKITTLLPGTFAFELANKETDAKDVTEALADHGGGKVDGKKAGKDSANGPGGNDGKQANAAAPAFIEARGYFANTYVPGDKDLDRLRAELRATPQDKGVAALDEQAHAVRQPFDRPVGQAMALSLSADHTAVAGPTRLTLQVGLAGAAQAATRRSALDVALVIDVGSAGAEVDRQALWSIAQAFVAERQAGDSFAVVIAGPARPVVLRGDALSAAEVVRALAAAVEPGTRVDADQAQPADQAAPAALSAAIDEAYRVVGASASADAAIGANAVVVASARAPSLDALPGIGATAERGAVQNITLSTIGVGMGGQSAVLTGLAQVGQGRRWVAASPDDARRVVTSELAAAGRAVARMVRLRIRLAPGVKLVEVVGSGPLDVTHTRAVKSAEASIDKKVAEQMGIASDRGEDEDGIQIVIPAFMAGDDHAILLDVVVPGPGPVLDVHAKWKDLVRMQNGEAQASLSLPNGADQPTPLSLNVVENRAAHLASDTLLSASRIIRAGDLARADNLLGRAGDVLAALAGKAPAVQEQVTLLAGYRQLMARMTQGTGEAGLADYLVKSLEASGRALK